jgi:hypothetical protein
MSSERDELLEKRLRYRQLIDMALDQLTLDDIRDLVSEMEEKLRNIVRQAD